MTDVHETEPRPRVRLHAPTAGYEAFEILRTDDGVAELRLNRPDILNRFDHTLHVELPEAMAELGDDPDVLAVVFSSEGRYFSAGGDTDSMKAAAGDLGYRFLLIDMGRRLYFAFADFPKPLVVALHGDVYGVGATVALLGDALVSAPGVKIVDPHVRFGLVAGDGGCVAWPANMGSIKARRHLLTGDPLLAEEAHRIGVVSDLVDTVDEVRPAALEIARTLASLPPVAVQLTKRALNRVLQDRGAAAFDLAFSLEAVTFGSEDLQEAMAAFHEGRKPVWKGR